jgi:hypothetical protein
MDCHPRVRLAPMSLEPDRRFRLSMAGDVSMTISSP